MDATVNNEFHVYEFFNQPDCFDRKTIVAFLEQLMYLHIHKILRSTKFKVLLFVKVTG